MDDIHPGRASSLKRGGGVINDAALAHGSSESWKARVLTLLAESDLIVDEEKS
jgi:hypothetical protein